MIGHPNPVDRKKATFMSSASPAGAILVTCLSLVSSVASAEGSKKPDLTRTRPFGLVAQFGGYSGVVAGVQGAWKVFGGRLTGGWNPVLVVLDDKNTDESKLNFYASGHLNLDLLVVPFTFAGRSRVGGSVGYKFDSTLGHGLGVAFEAQVALDPKWAMLFTAGASFYPDGENKLREDRNIEDRFEFGFPSPIAQIGLAIGMAFFP